MGDLPKLLTRAFAIGYLLPAAALVITVLGVIDTFGYAGPLREIAREKDITLGVIALLALSFTAILLLALNRPLIRTLEGYGTFNPARLWAGAARRKYRNFNEQVAETRRQWDEAAKRKQAADPMVMKAHADALWMLATDFPDAEEFVLATKFGNALRAFEVYPRVVYGIESTYGWTRLHGVIPKDYRELINDEKSQVDFWVNLWFTGCVCLIVYLVLAGLEYSLPMPWIPFAALALALGSARGARIMAYSWGILVTSAFDLFREDLAAKLGLKLPRTIEKERAMWQCASQVWIYRSAKAAKALDVYRLLESREGKKRK